MSRNKNCYNLPILCQVVSGTSSVPARWQKCASTVNAVMPEVIGRLFVETAFKDDSKTDVTFSSCFRPFVYWSLSTKTE
ncbi:hypothetical protein DPMN_092833 [Dreissena polymorpha]|uniref:Peptidase M13 N-terminal domain-containing protein n=1 Tax=Dreissena polymorpha TaxID=45954 RepID=A0A9D4L4E9_DREPO|nr:hypothetical protein DPMN_092833 [Dreissena polymorpha]